MVSQKYLFLFTLFYPFDAAMKKKVMKGIFCAMLHSRSPTHRIHQSRAKMVKQKTNIFA